MKGPKRINFNWTKAVLNETCLQGLRVAIIGGTNGIGQGIAREMVSKGANAIVVGRTFRDQNLAPRIEFVPADLSLMETSRKVAKSLPVEDVDMFIFTNGILPTKERIETVEGLEIDMATSYLSRVVMLNEIVPRLSKPSSTATKLNLSNPRIFVMGFPGVNQIPTLDDFNSAKAYSLMGTHQNTVVGNEALVLHYAQPEQQQQLTTKIDIFGLNPGLIKTSIRSSLLGTGFLFNALESMMSMFNPSVEEYAKNLVPLLVSPELNNRPGMMFDQKAKAIAPSSNIDPTTIQTVRKISQELIDSALKQK